MKLALNIVIILALAVGWIKFVQSEKDYSDEGINEVLTQMEIDGVPEEEIEKKESEMRGTDATNKFTGMLLGFLTAGYVGVIFVTTVLPALAHKATHAVYDSGEVAAGDPMHDARSFLAQGEYEAAIESFREAAAADPMNRVPYVEIAKIQSNTLEDPDAAIQTLTQAIEGQSWEENDAAFLMFRLAELYKDEKNDIAMASAVMQQVIEMFPATRHSANAQHKLNEWKTA